MRFNVDPFRLILKIGGYVTLSLAPNFPLYITKMYMYILYNSFLPHVCELQVNLVSN